MGLLFVETLPGPKVFKCKLCKVDSASQDEIVSKDFQGRVNVCLGPNEDRHLLSGLHTVNDVHCSSCQQILGWRYLVEEKNFYAAHINLLLGSLRLPTKRVRKHMRKVRNTRKASTFLRKPR
ncbi:hypothetical protein M5K25_008815 [Dendrobium thyrsiflorum]|uniref:Yippee domain-containing protein n=1 Tax=Dendrobium thyrsiflorum TaxID=117978 RepID=A0ABD0V9P3_DENTH